MPLQPWWFGRRLRKCNPLAAAGSYALYYGFPGDDALARLSAYDLAMIEPHSYSAGQIAALKQAGTLTVGYISIMETPSWNARRTERLIEADYMLQGGGRHHFPEWDSYLMDLTCGHYRLLLLEEIEDQIAAKGLDGILLDTVGDIEEFVATGRREPQLAAYVELLRELKRRYPALALVQNRGFAAAKLAARWLDGFLWEDWNGSWRSSGWMRLRVKQAKRWRRSGIRIFTLSRSSDGLHAAESAKLGFVHHARPNGYNEW